LRIIAAASHTRQRPVPSAPDVEVIEGPAVRPGGQNAFT
jgi:hypothetical protein